MSGVNLVGRAVLITGASRGIGLSVAGAFAEAGAELHLVSDDEATVSVAASFGGRGCVADVTDAAAIGAIIQGIPKLDVLINNAGLERLTPLEDLSGDNESVFRRVIEINVVGTFLVARAALGIMTTGARIINTASTWGRIGEPLFGAYVASKHAVIGLTKAWAKELGPRGIAVNAVAPGWVRTGGSARSLTEMAARRGISENVLLDEIVGHQAMPALMEPDDITGPYLFLASDLAANITGQTLGIDRGEVPW